MPLLRKLATWLVLASYLFAGTGAELFHDHRHCGGALANHDSGHGSCHGQHHEDEPGDADDHKGDRGQLPPDDHCVVCQFLAQAPLPAPAVVLIPGGEIAPDEPPVPALRVAAAAIGRAHLARGPPARS